MSDTVNLKTNKHDTVAWSLGDHGLTTHFPEGSAQEYVERYNKETKGIYAKLRQLEIRRRIFIGALLVLVVIPVILGSATPLFQGGVLAEDALLLIGLLVLELCFFFIATKYALSVFFGSERTFQHFVILTRIAPRQGVTGTDTMRVTIPVPERPDLEAMASAYADRITPAERDKLVGLFKRAGASSVLAKVRDMFSATLSDYDLRNERMGMMSHKRFWSHISRDMPKAKFKKA